RQVVESHTRAQSLRDQLATTKQTLATASETLRLTRERKQFAVGAVLEDIQAQQELTRARSDYLSAIAEFDKAQYSLSRAIAQPGPLIAIEGANRARVKGARRQKRDDQEQDGFAGEQRVVGFAGRRQLLVLAGEAEEKDGADQRVEQDRAFGRDASIGERHQ